MLVKGLICICEGKATARKSKETYTDEVDWSRTTIKRSPENWVKICRSWGGGLVRLVPVLRIQ